MSEHPMETLHGSEFACMLIAERLPFRTTYDEYQTVFFVDVERLNEALGLLMILRANKL